MEYEVYARKDLYDAGNNLLLIKGKKYIAISDDDIHFEVVTENKSQLEIMHFTTYGGESDEHIKDMYKYFISKRIHRQNQIDKLFD